MSIDDRFPENWRASIDRRIAQLLEPGILTREEMASVMRDVSAPAVERAKPWINPTPWKRGRKAQRIRA